MHKKRFLSVTLCIVGIWLISQFGLFSSLNSFFNSRFQSESLFKQNQFSTITIEQTNKNNFSYDVWAQTLTKVLEWTDSNIYLIDFFASNDSESFVQLSQNPRIHFVQSSLLDEDSELVSTRLPDNINVKNKFSLNYPNFSNGVIQDYQIVENLHTDVIQHIYQSKYNISHQSININFMIGESYLPAVNFNDVIENKIDQRLFNDKSVIIVNQTNTIVPTALSHARPVTQSQYYGYLFETALQNIELNTTSPVVLLCSLVLIGLLVLLISYFLPKRIRLFVVIFSSLVLLGFSFLLLGASRNYIPVIELVLAVILPMYFIQQQDSFYDKEQLLLGTRLYNQILESTGKSKKHDSSLSVLEYFSRFFCSLTGVHSINYSIKSANKTHDFLYDGSNLSPQEQSKSSAQNFQQKLVLLHNFEATISINELPEGLDPQILKNLLTTKEQYLKVLLSQIGLEQNEKSRNLLTRLFSKPRYTAEHEKFRITTENFLSHYHLLKNNFESLQTSSILFGVNGEIIQTNLAAEQFIRENDIRVFNQSMTDSLVEITDLEQHIINSALLDLLEDQATVIVWPTRQKGFDKSYLVSLSAYNTENINFGGFLIELLDVEEVNYISTLKNNFISELNNQLRNDFSEVMLAIDFLAMGIEGGLSLEQVNNKVIEFSEKLKSSDLMLQTTNDIMRKKQYPVDIRELVAQSVKAISETIDEKQIALNIKQPRFINLVLVNYQHFAQICKQLMLFAVQDCMDEGELSLIINELEIDSERFVSIDIKTKGYGIFDKTQFNSNAVQNTKEIPELIQIEKYILSLGGQIKLESNVGEGSSISTLLPCYRF